jgi:hypothetical protein
MRSGAAAQLQREHCCWLLAAELLKRLLHSRQGELHHEHSKQQPSRPACKRLLSCEA